MDIIKLETKEAFERLKTNVAVLKKNRDNVPLEELKTRYKTGYQNLLDNINGDMKIFVLSIFRDHLKVKDDTPDVVIDAIVDNKNATIRSIGDKLIELIDTYNVDEFSKLVQMANYKSSIECFGPYWEKEMCTPFPVPDEYPEGTLPYFFDGYFYNIIMKRWIFATSKDKPVYERNFYPPTVELMIQDYEESFGEKYIPSSADQELPLKFA